MMLSSCEVDTLVVAGSRSISDYDVVHKAIIDSPFWPMYHGTIISGDAAGVDKQVNQFASELWDGGDFDIDFEEYEANWDTHGKAAGPIRNEEMAKEADALIAVWDGESNGTRNMIEKALEQNCEIFITVINDE